MQNFDDDWTVLEDLVFSTISPDDVHTIMANWGGTSYPQLIEALGLFIRLQETRRAKERRLTLDEMAQVRAVGTYTLQ